MIRCSLEEKNLIIEFLTSELDHHITNEVRDEIDIILDSKSIKNIIFDFKNIPLVIHKDEDLTYSTELIVVKNIIKLICVSGRKSFRKVSILTL